MSIETADLLEYCRIVEAIVFAGKRPVSEDRLAEALPPDVDLQIVLESLIEFYRDRGAELERTGDGCWRFSALPVLAQLPPLPDVMAKPLSPAATQVLAQIVWGQPISVASIDEIRGRLTGASVMRTLVEGGWIEPGMRLQEPGEPVGWVTTPAFLQRMGLNSLDDLPDPDELQRGPDREEEDLEKTRLGFKLPIGRGTE